MQDFWYEPGDTVAVVGDRLTLLFVADDGAGWILQLQYGEIRYDLRWTHETQELTWSGDNAPAVREWLTTWLTELGGAMGTGLPLSQLGPLETKIVGVAANYMGENANSHIHEVRLRSMLGHPDKAYYEAALSKIEPRLITRYRTQNPLIRATLTGLMIARQTDTRRILDAALRFLSARYAEEPDFPSFTLAQVIEYGKLREDDAALAYIVIDLANLRNGGSGSLTTKNPSYEWGPPRDIEEISECQDTDSFLAYLAGGRSGRMWSTAPLCLPRQVAVLQNLEQENCPPGVWLDALRRNVLRSIYHAA